MGEQRTPSIDYAIDPCSTQGVLASPPYHRYVLDDGTVWTEFYRHPSGYLLRFPGLADFSVSEDGQRVRASPVEGVESATLEHLFTNQLVPLALSRQGKPAFHASVVTVPGGAVAFLGRSGAGKSTLAAAFASSGGRFLSDDVLLLEEGNNGYRALPGHASIRLWQDSADAILSGDSTPAPALGFTSKARLLADSTLTYQESPCRILAVYLLEPEGEAPVTIEPLANAGRFTAWLGNSFLLDIQSNDMLKAHFDWTHKIAAEIPSYRLHYARDYRILCDVRDSVSNHVAGLHA